MSSSSDEQLLNPPPGSAAAAARDFGIDLTLLSRRLKLTPEERLNELQQAINDLEAGRAAADQLRRGISLDTVAADLTATRR